MKQGIKQLEQIDMVWLFLLGVAKLVRKCAYDHSEFVNGEIALTVSSWRRIYMF